MADLVIQNALQLRHLAEHASSLRGLPWNLYAHEMDGKPRVSMHPTAEGPDFVSTPIMELETRFQQPWRVVPEVSITVEGEQTSLERYDAVFWSEAAVEKFVLPYYASKSLWMAAHMLAVLSRHWYGFIPGVDPAPELDGPLPVGISPIPFALAHLPTSDYIMLDEHVPGADLHLLYAQADGKMLAKSLADLLRAERDAEDQNG